MTILPACGECGRDGFADLRALRSHETSHKRVACLGCGEMFAPSGLGPHRRRCAGGRDAQHAEEQRQRALVRLVDDLDDDVAERLRQHLSRCEQMPAQAYLVVGRTYGPFLTSRQNVGGLVAAAEEACIVVHGALLAEALR